MHLWLVIKLHIFFPWHNTVLQTRWQRSNLLNHLLMVNEITENGVLLNLDRVHFFTIKRMIMSFYLQPFP